VTDRSVAVIGGGIAGLAAAWELARHPGTRVTLIEGSSRLGGKIATEEFAGADLDTGPDAFLARVPAARSLAVEAGLESELVAPGTGQAWLWRGGRLRSLPAGLVLGVPTDPAALARSGIVGRAAAARAALDLVLPGQPVGATEDVAVGPLVRRRLGPAVQLGLVDPLVGGINAGHTDELSAAVSAPNILAAARRDTSLIRGLRRVQAEATQPAFGGGPGETGAGSSVFLTVRGGLGRLVEAIAGGLAREGVEVVVSDAVTHLARAEGGAWRLTCASGRTADVDAVVVTCPAPAAADLLRGVSPGSASTLDRVRLASVVLTLLSYPGDAIPPGLAGSGFLVPRPERHLLTAASWVGTKWPHLAQPDRFVIRASAGRIDDERVQAMGDEEVVRAVTAELGAAMGLRGRPAAAKVVRWDAAFPQYEVGHLERMSALDRRLAEDAPGVVMAGAVCRGVGIATCIAGAREAAARALGPVVR
jgi:oxygen-dependent protoporphyrinogen oxidase